MDGMLGMIGHLNDTRFVRAASGLSPAVVRVGGITGDWVRYVFTQGTARGGELAVPPPPHVGGYWPTSENNFTVGPGGDWETLTTFIASSGLSLMLTLNELHGRNCSTRKPGCPTCDPVWCVGPWDTSNVRALLQHIHDAGEFGRLVQWFELGPWGCGSLIGSDASVALTNRRRTRRSHQPPLIPHLQATSSFLTSSLRTQLRTSSSSRASSRRCGATCHWLSVRCSLRLPPTRAPTRGRWGS